MKKLRRFYEIETNGITIKLPKWQTEPFTDNILQQLHKEPKVILEKGRIIYDHYVPDVRDISVDCNKTRNIYEDKHDCKNTNKKVEAVEEELNKMFQNVTEDTVIRSNIFRKSKNHKHKKSKKDRLVDLFGSPLDDLDISSFKSNLSKAKKVMESSRRHTLPVSLNITEEVLKPLKIQQKRKSEADLNIECTKIKKVLKLHSTASINYIQFECNQVSELFIPPIYKETAKITREATPEKVVINKVSVGTSEIVKSSKTIPPFIDLTKEYRFNATLPKIQILIKSEEAKTVSESRSMPLLSPISPAQPNQTEAELPSKMSNLQAPPVFNLSHIPRANLQSEATSSVLSKKPNQNLPLNVTQILKRQTQTEAELPLQTVVENSVLNMQNIVRSSNPQPKRPSAPLNVEIRTPMSHLMEKFQIQTQYQQTANSNRIQFIGNERNVTSGQSIVQAAHQQQQRNISHINQTQPPNQQWNQPQRMPSLNVRKTQEPPPPYPPQLYKLLQTPTEFELISNCSCAQKIFNYIHKILELKLQVAKFYEVIKTIFPRDMEKDHHHKLYSYFVEVVNLFGRKLISDLSTVDVQNFAVIQVLYMITAQLACYNHSLTVYGVCFYTHYMLKSNTALCTTPFLKKFLQAIQMVLTTFEKKTEKLFVITEEQKKVLEKQIHEYLRIDSWLKTKLGNSQSQKRKRNNKQIKENQPKIILLQNLNVNKNLEIPRNLTIQRVIETVQNPSTSEVPIISTTQTSSATVVPNSVITGLVQSYSVTANQRQNQRTDISDQISEASTEGASETEISSSVKNETVKCDEEVIDLTWIDDCNDVEILEEINEFKAFPFKVESFKNEEDEESTCKLREVVSPSDSGVGSPGAQNDNDGFKCLCGNRAIYVCACNSSMYCSRDCQAKDWIYHQKLCNKIMS